MLKKITSNIWVKEQPLRYLGLEVGTRMTVIRLANNQVVLISPIKLDNQIIKEINCLGIVKYIVAPNLFHYLYIEECKKIYPKASLITPPGLDKKINIKSNYIFTQDEISFLGELEYFLFDGFRVPTGTKVTNANEIVFHHPESKTLIITDIAFHFDSNFPLITQFATKILGGYQQLRPSILEKIVIKERETMINSITRLLEWDFQRVIMAHGTIIEENAAERLKAGYEWFLDTNLAAVNQ